MIKRFGTFRGGIHLPDCKSTTSGLPIEEAPLPDKVIIPLKDYESEMSRPLVSLGDRVKTGQIVAESKKFISSPKHASLSGKVIEIDELPHSELKKCKAIVIASDGQDEKFYSSKESNAPDLSRHKIRELVKNAGLIGMGGAAFPIHVKFTIPEDKDIDSFIVNLCECEPYLTADYRVALEKTDEVLRGIEIGLKVLDAERAYIAIESDKKELISTLKEKVRAYPQVKVAVLKTKYPQGEEKQLIRAVLKRIVPQGKLPLDAAAVVNNIQTVLAIYEAVYLGKPLYERVITVTGEAVKENKNLKVRIGTPLNQIIKECGGITKDEVEIIFGGPLMGIAVNDLETPILGSTSGIVVLSKRKVDLETESPCIRCGRCVDVCPVNLLPAEINKAVKNKQVKILEHLYLSDCMECGCCAYICPSKIPLVERIKEGKEALIR
jgi:Na+-translocating ferredoxin:NAD+ oxidoreductase subunit C